ILYNFLILFIVCLRCNMEIKPVTPEFSVAEQLTEADLVTLKEAGYQTIICNRPDGEAEGQPTAHHLAAKAQELGLAWYWIPVAPGKLTDEAQASFKQVLSEAAEPVLAFCRTGTRSITLWALSQAEQVPAQQLISQVAAAGYDLVKC